MQKTLAAIITIVMLLTVFSGCGREEMDVPSNAPSAVTAVTDPEEGLDTENFLRLPLTRMEEKNEISHRGKAFRAIKALMEA